MDLSKHLAAAAILGPMAMSASHAATGIFMHGYGIQEQGMGGASVAAPQTALAAATNPAGMGVVGNRLDGAFGILQTNSGAELAGVDYQGRRGLIPFPEFGLSRRLTENLAVGVSVWGSGGGANYGGVYGNNLFPGNSTTADQLVFVNVAPTLAYQILPGQWLGASLVTGISTLYLDGIEAQTGQGNRGRDWAVGAGLRFGWYGELVPGLTGGAFYATEVHYSPFTKYSAILADGGRVDQPASFGVGLAYRVNPKVLVAFDFLRYLYADVPVFGNAFPGNGILGSKDGPGFGWRNQNVIRIGVSYDLSSKITLRAGFAEASSQIVSNNTAFSFAAPLTTRHNLTLGATYRPTTSDEISVAYSYGFRAAVKGSGDSLNAMTSPYNTVNFVAFGYSKKF
ncbi:OmpP1/FadL family transporter [Pandoraea pulmonicola]|uniref:Outer membrane protein transport protein (OMPP1/FadL/TodX) n=1 Tax=Pandoraea pulmonicola TaxID=93221 RepID=A0AAJ4ZG82_PANPU|nr:outer membrane protein transport protein [Pandoraea pulmonicola]AJC22880.1 hypothetical protein RO07_24870 [Pandoraea pulmonicola]SUA92801.1 Outer membrane protein transport protein (OMPP1/FadL/TodX) [Pandoraea pulmonicola]